MAKTRTPRPAPLELTKELLLSLIEEHHGNGTAIRQALAEKGRELTRPGLRFHYEKHGIVAQADEARARWGISGPRTNLTRGLGEAERDRLLDAAARTLATLANRKGTPIEQLVATAKATMAADPKIGIKRSALYRRFKVLGISNETIIARANEIRTQRDKRRVAGNPV